MNYAVVDVETTGGAGEKNRIMEIGIVLLNGTKNVGEFHALIDPGMAITPFVRKLTGITDNMVAGCPSFSELAESIGLLLQNRIFVAHNVLFDLKVMRQELKRCLIAFDPPRLCTVKLARRIFPGFASYSLHNLTHSLGLPDFNHHRALDDTLATAEILKMSIEKAGEEAVLKEVKNLKPIKSA